MTKKFRLPRKTKKKLRKGFWLHQLDEKGNSVGANPAKNEEDYSAHKKGELRNLFDKKNSRKKNCQLQK
ncbi:hypothetical protein [Aquimarina algiphila]|uniref:hypothetical protein n=1 Tax=Aquimarina algiphila TaxID=2047982 RepID=UPI002492EA9A|nr:hypothetical protein [Aquimarina algiphila]